jgi:hypothetical protein
MTKIIMAFIIKDLYCGINVTKLLKPELIFGRNICLSLTCFCVWVEYNHMASWCGWFLRIFFARGAKKAT